MRADPAIRKSLLSRMVVLVLGSTVLCFLGMMVLVFIEAQSEILTDLREESQALADSYTGGLGRESQRFAHRAGAVARGLEIMPDRPCPRPAASFRPSCCTFRRSRPSTSTCPQGPGGAGSRSASVAPGTP